MTTVVSAIRYGSNMGYAKSHTTTEVPDFTDLSYKADKIDVDRIKAELQAQLNASEKERENLDKILTGVIEGLDRFVDKELLAQMKEELLSNERLKREKDFVDIIGEELILRIKKQCEIERNAIHNEVLAFKEIDLNDDLLQRMAPLSSAVNQLVIKANTIQKQLDEFAQTKEEIETIHHHFKISCNEMLDLKKEMDRELDQVKDHVQQVSSSLLEMRSSQKTIAEACQTMEDHKNNMTKNLQQSETLLDEAITTSKMIETVSDRIHDEKKEIEDTWKETIKILNQNKDSIDLQIFENQRIQKDIDQMASQVQEKLFLLKDQALECDKLCNTILDAIQNVNPKLELIGKMKNDMMDIQRQTVAILNTQKSEINERISLELRSMSFKERMKWLFGIK